MNYRIILKENLNVIDIADMSELKLTKIFAEIGYDLLYVYDKECFINVLTCKEFISGNYNLKQKKEYIVDINELKNEQCIKKLFMDNPESEKIIVVHNNDVCFEINSMVEPPLQNNICKQLMALRYVSFFKEDLLNYFHNGTKIFLLCSNDIYNFFREQFPQCIFDFSQIFVSNKDLDDFDYIFDFTYGKKILKHLNFSYNVSDFSKIIEKIAFNALKQFCLNNKVGLWLFKLPTWNGLSCLSKLEQKNALNKTSINKLLNNNEYLEAFVTSKDNLDFIREKKYNMSFRYDDGYAYVQGNCFSPEISVYNGLRKTYYALDNYNKSLHLYGPCTTYGILVPDNQTIASYLQKKLIEKNIIYNVQNHGGMHGNNVLNSIMLALNTPVGESDQIILIDILQDYTSEDCSNFVDMNDLFNKNKNNAETYFFDFPCHCNSKANNLISDCIFSYIQKSIMNTPKIETKRKYISKFDKLIYANETNAAFRKFMLKLSLYKKFSGYCNYCVFAESLEESKLKDMVPKDGILFIFSSGENTVYSNRIEDFIKIKKMEKQYDKVKVIQLEHYFCMEQYYLENNSDDYLTENINMIESLLSRILDFLNIKYRFILNKKSKSRYEIIRNKVVSKISKNKGIKLIYK